MIISLSYKSMAAPNLNEDVLKKMLEKARNFNEENNISGCLLYRNGVFLQYLEGKENVTLNLFKKIKEDDRHTNVILLSYDYISERVFEDWEMAYEDFSSTNHNLQYLKLLMSLFQDTKNIASIDNPTLRSFWKAVKNLLPPESAER